MMKLSLLKYLAAATGVLFIASCMTTYDAAGQPVQTVTPGGAAALAAGAGLAGYAIGNSNNKTNYVPVASPYYGGYGYGRRRYRWR